MLNSSIALSIAMLALLSAPVGAQDPPAAPPNTSRTELFAGFGGQRGLDDANAPWRRTFRFALDVNVTDRVALVLSVPTFGVGVSSSTGSWVDYAVLAGPRFRFRAGQRVTPFAQVLAGVERGALRSNGAVPAVPPGRGTAFLLSFGGGVDVTLSPRLAWRAVQLDRRRQFGALNGGEHLAVSSGLVIRFGARK